MHHYWPLAFHLYKTDGSVFQKISISFSESQLTDLIYDQNVISKIMACNSEPTGVISKNVKECLKT